MYSFVIVKSCEDLPSVVGGVWNATNTLEGSNATLSCFHGYEATGKSGNIQCHNGSWGNLTNIKCIPIVPISTTMTTKAVTTSEELITEPTTSIEMSASPDRTDNELEGSSRHNYVITICVVVLVVIIILLIAVVLFR